MMMQSKTFYQPEPVADPEGLSGHGVPSSLDIDFVPLQRSNKREIQYCDKRDKPPSDSRFTLHHFISHNFC